MRYVLVFWALPLGIFWGWYFLSFYDINFGTLFFSRTVHDFAFDFYAAFLNTYLGTAITADAIPGMVAEASVVDTLLIMGILLSGAGRRSQIGGETGRNLTAKRFKPVKNPLKDKSSGGRIDPLASLSSRYVHIDQGTLSGHRR